MGVCVGVTDATGFIPRIDEKKTRERVEAASRENQAGITILLVDAMTLFVATCWITGLRYRLLVRDSLGNYEVFPLVSDLLINLTHQIYPILSELSLVQSMRFQVKQCGFIAFVLAGLPAYVVRTVGYTAREVLMNRFQRWMSKDKDSDHDNNTNTSSSSGKRLHAILDPMYDPNYSTRPYDHHSDECLL